MNAYGTKISKSRMGSPRFAGSDEPANGPVKTYKLSDEELENYRNGGKGMNGEQAQQAERMNDEVDLDAQLKKLEEELSLTSQWNIDLKQELDDLLEKYNKLVLDYETAEQVRYDLIRVEEQLSQAREFKKETEEVLGEEVNKREALERLVRLYV